MRFVIPLLACLLACNVGETFEDELDEDILDEGLPNRMGLTGARPIQGVKWWNPLVPDANEQATSAGLELPHRLDYATAIERLCETGVEALFIRKGEPKIMNPPNDPSVPVDPSVDFPCEGLGDAQCRKKIDGRIADALVALKANKTCARKPVVYIMQRQQLTSDAKIEQFARVELKGLLDELAARDVRGMVRGLALVESHLDGACAVKNRAVDVARAVNRYNGGFLKKRSLFVGGAGLGNRFKNLNSNADCSRGLRETLRDLADETESFSFLYKHFDNADARTCTEQGWDTVTMKNRNVSKADAKAYLLDGCPGLRDLVDGIAANAAEIPAHANVTFWGDGGDGVTNIPNGALAALHEIFVVDRPASRFHHAAFDRLFDALPDTAATRCPANEDHCKHLIQIDSARVATRNLAPASADLTTSVYDVWAGWQSSSTSYPQ